MKHSHAHTEGAKMRRDGGKTHLKQEMENIMKNTKKGGGGGSSSGSDSSSSVKGRSEQCWRISLHQISCGDAGQRLL